MLIRIFGKMACTISIEIFYNVFAVGKSKLVKKRKTEKTSAYSLPKGNTFSTLKYARSFCLQTLVNLIQYYSYDSKYRQ